MFEATQSTVFLCRRPSVSARLMAGSEGKSKLSTPPYRNCSWLGRPNGSTTMVQHAPNTIVSCLKLLEAE
eukprot:3743889-Alexandrium_andersonii.AAC.1